MFYISIQELLEIYEKKNVEKKIISFQIEEKDKIELERLADINSTDKTNVSVSELIRISIKELLKKNKKD